MLTLDQIKEKVYFEFRRAQTDAMNTERLGKIHVSDLIKPCMRNVIYKKGLCPVAEYVQPRIMQFKTKQLLIIHIAIILMIFFKRLHA